MTLPARRHCSAVGAPRQSAVPDARQHARFALVAALPRSLGRGPPVMSSSGFLRASAYVFACVRVVAPERYSLGMLKRCGCDDICVPCASAAELTGLAVCLQAGWPGACSSRLE